MAVSTPGCVSLVGAGPGDPDLLTLRGARCLREADVVLYDERLDRRLIDLTRSDCERIYVGKRGPFKSRPQEAIGDLLIERARQGQRVVRLKGGDPFVFGRGGEEALQLAAAGIPFEIVPGISAGAAVPAYAGIPLTHRDLATSAVLVTGHETPGQPASSVDWRRLAPLDSTLVIFMGVRKLDEIADQLLVHGRSPDTPVAVIEQGTSATQRTLVAELTHVADRAREAGVRSPALIVVGQVVGLRQQLAWFEKRPLFGKRILVTRRAAQADDLRDRLEKAGAEVHLLPLIEIGPPEDSAPLDRAIEQLPAADWIIFTSPNAVDFFFARLAQLDRDARALASTRIAVVGQTTADALLTHGIRADLIPVDASQDSLIAAFAEIPVEDQEILIPASAIGRAHIDDILRQRGARVHRVTVYENSPPAPGTVEIPASLTEGRIDLIVFASPSAVRNFGIVVGEKHAHQLLSSAALACIGPTTARAVQNLGLPVHVQPDESSVPALVDAICAHCESL